MARPPRRILVILLSEMGSLVLAHPMFARLKQQYPGASIHALLFAKNREVLDLLGVIPRENVLTLDDRSLGGFVADSLKVLRALRALKLDVVIDCELFARISSIFSGLSGRAVRVGFHRHTQEGLYRGSFINRPVLYNPYRHLSHQFLTLVAAIESNTVPVGKDAAAAALRTAAAAGFPEGRTAAGRRQAPRGLSRRSKTRRLVLVYPSGGLLPIRAWPLEHYFRLCTALLEEGYAVGVIGLPADKPIGQAIVAHCRKPALHRPDRLHRLGAPPAGAVSSRLIARHQRWRPRAVRGAYAGAHDHSVRPGNAAALRAAGEKLLLLPSAAALFAVPHGLQPPDFAVRRR